MRICPGLSCPGGPEEWLDPDMYGIGIIIAFAVTAGLALFVSIAAVIRGAIPDYQYGWLDKKLLSGWLLAKVRKAPKERPENLGYQLFLLTLSDQILLTGIAYAITMYARICHLSVMSFQIGSTLIRLSSTVHFCTLIVLKLHFLEHRRQAGLRCVLMVVFLGLFFAVDFMASYTSLCNMRKFFFCELYSEAERPEFIVADCLAVFLTTSLLYWNGIRSIKPPKEDSAPYFSTTSTLYFFYSCGNRRTDVDAYLVKKQAEWYSARERDNDILRQKPNFFKVFCITAPALLLEIYASSFLEVVLATLWFSTTIWGLSDVLSVLGSEIAEFSFGQIMPVLLLIVYAVTAMEVGNFKKPPKATVEDPSASKPIQEFGLVEAPVTTEGNLSQLDASSERASFEDGNDGQTSSQAQCLLPESNSSTLDIASTIGPRTSTDSSSGLLRTPNRNNTLEMEEGRDASWPFKINLGESEFVSYYQVQQSTVHDPEWPAHPVDVGMKHAKEATMFSLAIVILLFIVTMVMFMLYFTWTSLALIGLLLLLFLKELVVDIVRIHLLSVEHQGNGDRVNAHPMDDLPAQDGPTQGDSRGTSVDLGQSPVSRRSL